MFASSARFLPGNATLVKIEAFVEDIRAKEVTWHT